MAAAQVYIIPVTVTSDKRYQLSTAAGRGPTPVTDVTQPAGPKHSDELSSPAEAQWHRAARASGWPGAAGPQCPAVDSDSEARARARACRMMAQSASVDSPAA